MPQTRYDLLGSTNLIMILVAVAPRHQTFVSQLSASPNCTVSLSSTRFNWVEFGLIGLIELIELDELIELVELIKVKFNPSLS